MIVTIYSNDISEAISIKTFCERVSIPCQFKKVGVDINEAQLYEMTHGCTGYPQVFITEDGLTQYVGGLRQLQERLNPNKQTLLG